MTTKEEYAEKIVRYVETHPRYSEFTNRDAALAAINCLLYDVGAAHDFLQVIGVDIDLHTYDFIRNKTKVCIRCKTTKTTKWWKCCPKHTTQKGPDVLCMLCVVTYHSEYGELEEVIDDRADGASVGGDQTPGEREDPMGRRRLRKIGYRAWVLRQRRNSS